MRPPNFTALAMGILFCLCSLGQAKVLELSDRFLPLRHEGMWLVKFYAPWCGHCKKLEPVFKHVGQSLAHENIRVGRVDCTRFTNVAKEFDIRGYPTILFLKGDHVFRFEGDRTRADIVNFALRLLGPPVNQLESEKDLRDIIETRDINFVYIGNPQGPLWDAYHYVSSSLQQHEFFYQMSPDVAKAVTGLSEDDVVRVFKDGTSYKFEGAELFADREQRNLPEEDSAEVIINQQQNAHNHTLKAWVITERFPLFVKITRGRFSHVMSTRRFIVMAVLEENKIGEMSPEMEEFRDMVEFVAKTSEQKFRDRFQFGWTGSPDLANSIAMDSLPLPSLIVVNSSTYQHYLPDDDPTQLTTEAIKIFLDQVLDGSAPVYGGSSYIVRLYRVYFEAKTKLWEMWRGNPALTAVLFGLPLGFFALICYSICCADIMDAEEEEEDERDLHEKTD